MTQKEVMIKILEGIRRLVQIAHMTEAGSALCKMEHDAAEYHRQHPSDDVMLEGIERQHEDDLSNKGGSQ